MSADFGWHFVRNCEIIHTTPPPPPSVSTCYQVVSWTSLSGLVQLVVVRNKSCNVSQLGRGAICCQFWWEVASSRFCDFKPLFWLVGWWRDKIWCRGKPICGEAPSIADSRWMWPPAHRVLPTRQVWWGSFTGCVARVVFDCVVRVIFWLCRQGCFWLCCQGFCWLCCQGCCWLWHQVCSLTVLSGISLVGSGPGYPGCVIKG